MVDQKECGLWERMQRVFSRTLESQRMGDAKRVGLGYVVTVARDPVKGIGSTLQFSNVEAHSGDAE
jgi:hypothetical protein